MIPRFVTHHYITMERPECQIKMRARGSHHFPLDFWVILCYTVDTGTPLG